MKSLKTFAMVMGLMAVTSIWTACKKEQSPTNPNESANNPAMTARNGGAVEDNPEVISKVPFVISSDMLHNNSGVNSSGSDLSLSSRGPRPKPGIGDITAPSVSISSPTQGATLTPAVTTVSVNSSDNVGVASLSLLVNGTVVQTVNASSYNFSWDATPYSGTTPTLTATAKDAAGNTNSYIITVSVSANVVVLPPPPSGSLPTSYQLAAPTPGNQGNEFACVVFATTYAARSIEQYYRSNAGSYSLASNIFSPEYVYDQTKFSSDCGAGTSVGTALEFMKQSGVCTWQTMPFSDVNGCSVVPTGAQNAEAANFKIGGYSKIISSDQTAIKTMISSKHPVIFNVSVDDGFIAAKTDFTWSSYSGSGGLPHCLTIVGYDDSKHAFRIINSWGTGWGGGGFCWIDYSWFTQVAGYYSYVMNY